MVATSPSTSPARRRAHGSSSTWRGPSGSAAKYAAMVAAAPPGWRVTDKPSPSLKSPERCGPFREAFRNRVLFVYGTRGTAAENAWAYAKARFDAETFWYRGNGSIDLVADTAFDPRVERERSVVLYGNRQSNAAWSTSYSSKPPAELPMIAPARPLACATP